MTDMEAKVEKHAPFATCHLATHSVQRIALEIALETVPLSWNYVNIQLVERPFDLDSARHHCTAWSPSTADTFSNAQIGLGIEMFGPAAFA